jgi:hypothetical protein
MGLDVVQLIYAKITMSVESYPVKLYVPLRLAGSAPDGQERLVQGTPNPSRRRKLAQHSSRDSRGQPGPAP